MSKRNSVTLLFAVLIATVVLFTHTTASARVCLFRIGGTCVFWSGSVKGVLSANVPENFKQQPVSLGFTIDGSNGLPGTVYCQNPGTNSVKVKPEAIFTGRLRASERITQGDIYMCEGQEGAIVAPVAKLDDKQLRRLDKFCGDPNLKAIDFVPFIFEASIRLKDMSSGKSIESINVECTLPDQDKNPLRWDEENKRPEKRRYECRKTDQK